MNFVSLEVFADAIGPREQINDVRRAFEVEQPLAFGAGDVSTVEHSPAKFRDADITLRVKGCSGHA